MGREISVNLSIFGSDQTILLPKRYHSIVYGELYKNNINKST
jgi:hypothetical protein